MPSLEWGRAIVEIVRRLQRPEDEWGPTAKEIREEFERMGISIPPDVLLEELRCLEQPGGWKLVRVARYCVETP